MQMKATEARSRVSLLNTEKVPQTGNEDETSGTAIRPSAESKVNAATGKLNNLFKLKVFPQPWSRGCRAEILECRLKSSAKRAENLPRENADSTRERSCRRLAIILSSEKCRKHVNESKGFQQARRTCLNENYTKQLPAEIPALPSLIINFCFPTFSHQQVACLIMHTLLIVKFLRAFISKIVPS